MEHHEHYSIVRKPHNIEIVWSKRLTDLYWASYNHSTVSFKTEQYSRNMSKKQELVWLLFISLSYFKFASQAFDDLNQEKLLLVKSFPNFGQNDDHLHIEKSFEYEVLLKYLSLQFLSQILNPSSLLSHRFFFCVSLSLLHHITFPIYFPTFRTTSKARI